MWAPFDPLGCGHSTLALSLFFLSSSFSLFLCFLPAPAALSVWLAAAPVRLVVRLWVVGCPPAASRPKGGGLVGWLFASVGLIVQLICYFVGCSRLGLVLQLIYLPAGCSACQPVVFQVLCSQ